MVAYKRRFTEKPLKALANLHPAILIGNYGALEQIRDFGFQTFDGWIDESYDRIEDPQDRFEAAYAAFLDFREKSRALILNDSDLRDLLIRNAQTAMVDLRVRYRDEFDPALVKGTKQAVPLQGQ